MSIQYSKTELEETLECNVCAMLLNGPKQLHCGHTFCHICIEKMMFTSTMGRKLVTCPHCREETVIPTKGLPTNFLIGEMISKLENVDLQTTDKLACLNCKTMVPNVDIAVCKTCSDVLLCSLCILKHHKGHDVDLLRSYAIQKRIANAAAYIQHQKSTCKIFVDILTSVDDSLLPNSEKETIKKMFTEYDVILSQMNIKDAVFTEEELCALIARAKQVTAAISHIHMHSLKIKEQMRRLFQSVSDTARELENGLDCSIQQEELKTILQDDSLSQPIASLFKKTQSVTPDNNNSSHKNVFAYQSEGRSHHRRRTRKTIRLV